MRTVKPVKVGNACLDGSHIYIQSMLNARSDDISGSVAQAVALEQAGCEILRAAIPNQEAIALIPAIKQATHIGGLDRVKQVVHACQAKNIPIRIGVNSGSLEKEILAKYGAPTPEALVESAMGHVQLLEQCDFEDIVISMKSSNVHTMIEAYRLAAQRCSYPLHLGVTEAGTAHMGIIKSAIGIGSLLHDGIGETIRVSLTDDPIKEIAAAKDILRCLGKREGPDLIACPTCGRTRIDLVKTAKEVEAALFSVEKNIKVAVMGCVVNGPGEAREADIGVAGGDGCAVLFKKGTVLRKVKEEDIVKELLLEIEKL